MNKIMTNLEKYHVNRGFTIKIMLVVLFLLVSLLLLISGVTAQSTNGYDLSWWTVDAGGGTSTVDGFTMIGAIGQPDAGALAGGGYTIIGGFWSGGEAQVVPEYMNVFLPLVVSYQ